ncbi:hypothetical protein D3C85_1905060 [compost metagenome]
MEIVFSDKMEISASCTSDALREISSNRAMPPASIARMMGLCTSASGVGPFASSMA